MFSIRAARRYALQAVAVVGFGSFGFGFVY